jgi:hypothetical protein
LAFCYPWKPPFGCPDKVIPPGWLPGDFLE